jgi:hypothetical protein
MFCYRKSLPIRLQLMEDMPIAYEPSPAELADVDDDTPDDEYKAPDPEMMTPEEYEMAMKVFEDIDDEVKRRALVEQTTRRGLAALREKVVKDLFAKLDDAEKEEWKERAKEEHASDLARWKKSVTDESSTDPADRQR